MSSSAKLQKNFSLIKELINLRLPPVFSRPQLLDLLPFIKEKNWMPQLMGLVKFIDFLLSKEFIHLIVLKGKEGTIERFSRKEFTTIELALSLQSNSWISHYSALELHGLAGPELKKIYVSQELTQKIVKDNKLEQYLVDQAFEKKKEPIKHIYKYKSKQLYLLKAKYSKRLGVIRMMHTDREIHITDLERTLIDCVVRPAYSGGVKSIIEAFSNARNKIDVPKMFNYLQQLKFIYPYHQAIGFYLEYTGYNAIEWSMFEKLPQNINFYLDYDLNEKILNSRWKLYVPSILEVKNLDESR